jgi:hypothetical protein
VGRHERLQLLQRWRQHPVFASVSLHLLITATALQITLKFQS